MMLIKQIKSLQSHLHTHIILKYTYFPFSIILCQNSGLSGEFNLLWKINAKSCNKKEKENELLIVFKERRKRKRKRKFKIFFHEV